MSHKSFSEKLRSPEWWLEQSAHWNAGDLIGTLAGVIVYFSAGSALWAGVAALVAGALSAAIRELAQNIGDDDNNVPDSISDWLFWTLGGARGSALFFAMWAVS